MRRGTGIFAAVFLVCALSGTPALYAAQPQNPDDWKLAAEEARREALLVQAVRNAYVPPQAGVIPHPNEIPMNGAWEDADWDTPLMQSIYRNPYSYGNNLDNYLPCLREALGGNPKAMLALSMYYYLWGDILEESYSDFPPQTHSADYWRAWAERLTNPGWVCLRLGDLHGRWPVSSLEYYRQGAELGNAEAMYNYYKISGKRRDYLYRSAAQGFARAAFLVSDELEKQGGQENLAMSKRYIWLAAVNADDWGLLHSSFSFYNGDFKGSFNNCEQGYLYSVLNIRYQHGTSFSTQRPDNICMLPPETINRLESTADRWQADYDQRRLPHVLRGRFKRGPQIQAMQDELAGLLAKLGVAHSWPGESIAHAGSAQSGRDRSGAAGMTVGWHLGFYSEEEELLSYDEAQGNLLYASQQFRAHNTRYIPWVYAFVSFTMLAGVGLIFYGQRIKQQKFSKHREQIGALADSD